MKFNTTIPSKLLPYFNLEIENYEVNLKKENLNQAWTHLEKAHIIGQSYPYQHSLVHWKMLQFGIQIKSRKEIIGQIPRLFFGGVKSFVGKIPLGNPGGSNVPPLKSFPIDSEIQATFLKAGIPLN